MDSRLCTLACDQADRRGHPSISVDTRGRQRTSSPPILICQMRAGTARFAPALAIPEPDRLAVNSMNSEIAATLSRSSNTVAWSLSKVYGNLGLARERSSPRRSPRLQSAKSTSSCG
jgi:hypothetical protein